MKKYSFYVPVEEKELIEFLSKLTNDNKLSETALKVMRFIMTNGFEELQNIDALKKEKIKVDIEYKKVATEFLRAKLKYTFNFDSLPSKQGSHAMKENIANTIHEGEMQSVVKFSFYDEKNDRIQCPYCGILFVWKSAEEKKIRKDEFIDHFIQRHRMFSKEEELEITQI